MMNGQQEGVTWWSIRSYRPFKGNRGLRGVYLLQGGALVGMDFLEETWDLGGILISGNKN